ncbi:MAG: Rne/Rng family ribonuclease [Methylacidiphilales bacterium]|nr:Rne/Rng family ribonuclease [Candidatus Methylacidiphilales bacterium]MDW8349273.1 Rne/Rng family ribonuclease [Verrucomicrobiae bacterium]
MFIDKVKQILGIKKNKPVKEIIISCERLERRVALLEDGRLEEFVIERDSDRQISGNIYKGRVQNIELGLKAMFIDIGLEKNAFLHFWDAIPAALDSGFEEIQRQAPHSAPKRITPNDIPNLYPVGSEIIVQVTKGPIGTKGPRVTTNLTLPGRYLVLTPFSNTFGISRKIEDPEERKRLRKILSSLDVPENMGVILRTVGEGQKARFFVRDLHMLLEQWRKIEAKQKEMKNPGLLLAEPDIIDRTVRDFLTDDIDRIVVDDLDAANRMRETVGKISKRSVKKIRFYNEPIPIFEKFNIERQIDSAFRRQVWLPCGGSIVIDETEALVAIDVNTGRNKAQKEMDKTILQTNLEAAEEIARQLRLRNIGGLVVIDFIDMRDRRDQIAVFNRLRECLKRDKAKTNVLPISALGLVEMTRQRAQESISRAIYTECPTCKGRGMIKSPETMSVEIQRAITRTMKLHPEIHELRIIVNPQILERLRTEDEDHLIEIERRFQGKLIFRPDPKMAFEEFQILDANTNQALN